MSDTDARLWHPWLRINRVLRVMLHTRWSAEAWSEVRVEFRRALALRSGDSARGVVHLANLVAKRPAKKPDKQVDLPAPPPATRSRVLPMQLRIGEAAVKTMVHLQGFFRRRLILLASCVDDSTRRGL